MSLLWKLGGVAIALLAAYFLVTMYGKARYNQGGADGDVKWSAKVIEAERGKLVAYQAGVASVQREDAQYLTQTREVIVPMTRTIVERAAAYAQTPDGAGQCLNADRVLWLDQTRSALFPAPAAPAPGGLAGSVHPDPQGQGTGWLDEPGASRASAGAG